MDEKPSHSSSSGQQPNSEHKKRLSALKKQLTEENPPCDSPDCQQKDPQHPKPHYTVSQVLPKVALSQRFHPEPFQEFSKIWGCQSAMNIDKDGKKIPTSRLDFSVVHKRCGKKEYDHHNPHGYNACRNCEPDRFYVPRRESQDDNDHKYFRA